MGNYKAFQLTEILLEIIPPGSNTKEEHTNMQISYHIFLKYNNMGKFTLLY